MSSVSELFENLMQETLINEEPTDEKLVLRYVDSSAAIPLFVGLNKKTGTRYLFILLKDKLSNDLFKRLPVWNGLLMEQNKTSINIAGIDNKWFLVLHHQHKNDYKIFEAVIEDICKALVAIENYENLSAKLMRTMERWKHFFSSHGREGLSLKIQQGLYGELQVLRELLVSSTADPTTILNSWIGPERQPHDFSFSNKALEVKTLTSKKHYKVPISNEVQLDDEGYDHLYLIAIKLRKVDSGETLPEVILNIRNIFRENPLLIQVFNEKLFSIGYLDNQSELYNQGYLVQDIFSYRVEEGFPRLLAGNLPEGVGDINYTVQLSACDSFKVNFKDVINTFV